MRLSARLLDSPRASRHRWTLAAAGEAAICVACLRKLYAQILVFSFQFLENSAAANNLTNRRRSKPVIAIAFAANRPR